MIIPFTTAHATDVSEILQEAFPWYYNTESTKEEIESNMLNPDNIALVAIADDRVIGVIGALSCYGVTGWELHPLAVLNQYRGRSFGRLLTEALEHEVIKRGGVMMYLGSDDEFGTTSLYGVDLYEDTFEKIKNIKETLIKAGRRIVEGFFRLSRRFFAGIHPYFKENQRRETEKDPASRWPLFNQWFLKDTGGHPFPFYEKMGYKIVGVFPDANGIGKPDIWMAKRLCAFSGGEV